VGQIRDSIAIWFRFTIVINPGSGCRHAGGRSSAGPFCTRTNNGALEVGGIGQGRQALEGVGAVDKPENTCALCIARTFTAYDGGLLNNVAQCSHFAAN
jgi:hypothetical protein